MIDLKSVSWPKLAIAALMTIVPAVLSYCKASDEASDEAAAVRSVSRAENEAGYKALVDSVRHLEMVVAAQQETLVLLVQRSGVDVSLRMGSGSAAGSPSPTAAVDFPALPDSPGQALQMQAAPE